MRRMTHRTPATLVLLSCLCLLFAGVSLAQEESSQSGGSGKETQTGQTSDEPEQNAGDTSGDEKVNINLNQAPLRDFITAVSKHMGTDFVLQPEVKDVKVTVSLSGVSPQEALSVVLEAHNLVSEKMGEDIHLIKRRPPEKEEPDKTAEELKKAEDAKKGEEDKKKKKPLATEVIKLKYRNAESVQTTLKPLLTNRGNIQVVERSGLTGWSFQQASGGRGGGGGGSTGGDTFTARQRKAPEYAHSVLSQMLLITDTKKKLKEIRSVLDVIDSRPKQVLISSRIIEVDRQKMQDLGMDIANGEGQSLLNADLEGRASFLSSLVNPSAFQSDAGSSSTYPFNSGLNLMFEKVNGSEFQVLLHALHEKADAETLSAPKLLALDNHQATMLVGRRFPILSTQVSGTEVTQITSTLDYYENIGIQLNVVPQIQNDKYINLIIHPVVSTEKGTISARSTGGQALAEYPVIATREAETQVMIEDNQTIVIGGLLKEEEQKSVIGVPVLSQIPYLGAAFRRTTTNTVKQDLLLFLSAKIVSNPAQASENATRHIGKPEQQNVNEVIKQAKKLRKNGKSKAALRILEQVRLGNVNISKSVAERLQTLREELRKKVREEKQKGQDKKQTDAEEEKDETSRE